MIFEILIILKKYIFHGYNDDADDDGRLIRNYLESQPTVKDQSRGDFHV